MLSDLHVVRCKCNFCRLHSLHNSCSNFVWISCAVRTTIFQSSSPSSINCADGDTNGSTTVRNAVSEFIDGCCFMFAGQPEMIIRAIYLDVFFDDRTERFTYFLKYL